MRSYRRVLGSLALGSLTLGSLILALSLLGVGSAAAADAGVTDPRAAPAAMAPGSTQRDFVPPTRLASGFLPMPGVNPHAPDWGTRFSREMPSVASPYYGVNVVDVRREHYDAVLENIRAQVQGAEGLFGGRLHFFSATDYEEVRRVIFIIYFEDFPDTETVLETLRGIGMDVPADAKGFPDIWTGTDVWTEFTDLAEGYTWWIAPAMPGGIP